MKERVLAGAALLALLSAACQPVSASGQSSAGSSGSAKAAVEVSARTVLKLTADRASRVSSYAANLHQEETESGSVKTVDASLRFRRQPSTAFTADFQQDSEGGGSGTDQAHAVLVDGVLYLDVPALTLVAGGKKWFSIRLDQVEQFTKIDASALVGDLLESGPGTLATMFTSAVDPANVGADSVDGVRTTHLRGSVSVDAALSGLDPGEQDRARQLLRSSGTVSFDLWVDSGHLPRKASFRVTGSNTPTSTTVTFHYAQSVHVSAPPASEVGSIPFLS